MNNHEPLPCMTPREAAVAFIAAFMDCKTEEERERLAEWWNADQRRADHEGVH